MSPSPPNANGSPELNKHPQEVFVFPASYAQRRLWFFDRLAPGSPAYNICDLLPLPSPLDQSALARALAEIVRRHEALRTTFAEAEDGQPVQVISEPCATQLPLVDLSALTDAERQAELARLTARESQRPFDLASGPLLRTTLLRLSDEEHFLLFTFHHIVSDGWSLRVFAEELSALYEAFTRGEPSPLEELPVQYADYAVWQRGRLEGGDLETQLDYWRRALAGAPSLLELPTDRPRPSEQSFRGASRRETFGGELTQALRELSGREGCTLFMTLLAGFAALLHRYTGQSDVVVGTPVAGRPRVELESLIGFFVNTLALRVGPRAEMSFAQLLGRVREACLGAYANQEVPFERVVSELGVRREAGHNPLFQVMLVLQNTPGELAAAEEAEPDVSEDEQAVFDLTLTIEERIDGLAATLHYSRDLFEDSTAERMLGHLRTLLEAASADSSRTLSELPLLTEPERRRILFDWNDTRVDFPEGKLLHQLFEEQAAAKPDAVAVVYEGGRLTYAELNRRANRLAHRLLSLGAGPETVVAICAERSPEMIAAALGVLKAGAAYLPVDASCPAERVRFMLRDAGAALLLTQRRVVETLSEVDVNVILLDEEEDDAANVVGDENPLREVSPDNLAYVIYTSGSTGLPKGVSVQHGAICNRMLWGQQTAYRLTEADALLQLYNFGSDFALWECFTPLVAGARLVLPRPGGQQDIAYVVRLLAEERITLVGLVPSMLRALLDEPGIDECRSLRIITSGGEALNAELRERFFETLPWAELQNGYGPTEASVDVTCWVCRAGEARASVPIGRPNANTQLYVLDERLEPVPAGVAGQLYIGGANLARGYLGRPALTAERFVPDPFGGEAGARLYQTGDLARHLPDGALEFLGRVDHQVKVRGFRVELGEVEAVLAAHPRVRDCAVAAREDEAGSLRLVAYVVARQARTLTASELRRHALRTLPDYMVPQSFVMLAELPKTANGKVDRRSLPAPDAARPELESSYEPPRNRAEEVLAQVWSEVLGLSQVGVGDNFFELGGDSILSIQVIARANRAGLHLTPKQLFQHQTIAELAAVARAGTAVHAEQGIVTGEVPLTPIQHWFFEWNLPDPNFYYHSVLLDVEREEGRDLWEQVLAKLLEHHDALRLRYTFGRSGWRQTNAGVDARQAPLKHIDISALSEREQRDRIEEYASPLRCELDLSAGRLVHAVLFDCGEGRGAKLLVNVHHLAVDGVSWRVLLEDLQAVHDQLAAGEPAALGPKTTSFKHWAERLHEYAQTDGPRVELPHWLATLEAESARVPVDHAGGVNDIASERSVTEWLSGDETLALLRELPRLHRTRINDVLLTALMRVFEGWTGSGALLIDLEGHGREEIADDVDLSRTVGWFTSVYPVSLRLDAGAGAAQALRSVKEQLRRVPNRGIGYGLLRYLARGGEEVARLRSLPGAEVSFNYLGRFDEGHAEFAQPDQDWGDAVEAAEGDAGKRRPRGVDVRRSHLLDINGGIIDGQLWMSWAYSENVHRAETIESLARQYMDELRALVEQCDVPSAAVLTPEDFPLAPLDPAALEQLAGSYRGIEDIYPLSPMQSGMLFHSLYAPEADVYSGVMRYALHGPLDVEAFKGAWQRVAERHDSLRAAFVWKELDEPLQIIQREVSLPWEQHDWRALAAEEQRGRLEALCLDEQRRGFNLAHAPLMRFTLVRMGEDEYQFVWSCHHLLLDGWSVPLVFAEVSEVYDALTERRAANPPPARPYRDYIEWLRQQDVSAAEAFWRQELKGLTHPTPLASDRPPRRGRGDEVYGEASVSLGRAATAGLQATARRAQLTLNTLVRGAWAILLSRYSGEETVAFGATVSGRPPDLEGVEEMVGLFINTLPVLARVDADAHALTWLREQQARQFAAQAYEYSPLVEVQRWSEVPPGTPLFESLLVFENYPSGGLAPGDTAEGGGAETHSVEFTNYPLTLIAAPGEELSLRLAYGRSRFEDSTAERMLGHLRTLLEAIAVDPSRRLSELPLLTEEERYQILSAWNDTRREHAEDLCIHRLFESWAERTPDAVAVVHEGRRLTYRELNERANSLARRLRALGVGPEVVVGTFFERSADVAVGLLAILKAGGAYLPLDLAYPRERLRFMIEDAGAKVLLTERRLRQDLPSCDLPVACVDDAEADMPAVNLDGGATPLNLAYVIYTSGSTGRPKGVGITHRSVQRFVVNTNFVEVLPADTVAQVSNFSFDAAALEIWGALLNGARLVFISKDLVLSPQDFADELASQRVTTLFTTTALLNHVAGETPGAFAALDNLLFGGEAADPRSVRRVLEAGPPRRLVNLYGPTESTTACSWHLVASVEDDAPSVPIGRPVSNTRLYVLDAQLRPVPVGVAGELYVGGDGLARGYLNRPGLTAERFVPDPFSGEPGARLYRTGDLARYLPSGEIDFVGRADNQIKLRGFRVELGEVESALALHPSVREAVVMAGENGDREKGLVAYVVAARGAAPAASELRTHLRERLPDYMLPSAFVRLECLPLTPNGKVDRRALPKPGARDPEAQGDFEPPRTPDEEALAKIWSEVLGVGRVGVEDNFFELGGHSLLATQVVSRVHRDLGVELRLRSLFESPTLSGLAACVEAARLAGQRESEAPRITTRASGDDPPPLSYAQRRLWFFDRLTPGSHAYNICELLPLDSPLDREALARALNELLRRHESLRTTFAEFAGGEPVQVIAPPSPLELPLVDLSALFEDEARAESARLAAEESQRPFDLTKGPLLRTTLLRLSDEEHYLLLSVHHIVFDGWSLRVFAEELAALYEAFTRGEGSPLEELPVQYADYAVWQREQLEGGALDAQLDYWRRALAGAPSLLELPADRPRPSVPSFRGASRRVTLGGELTRALRELSGREGATLFMTLLAGFAALLRGYTGQSDLVVGTPVAGRTRVELEGLVGFFVNTLALRVGPRPEMTFSELLAQARRVCLDAYANQEVPFERVVSELGVRREAGHNPLFQVMLVLQNIPGETDEAGGAYDERQTERDDAPAPSDETSKFDLSLYFEERGGALDATVEYSTDLFEDSTAERMLGHLRTLLEAAAADPARRLSELPLLTEEERYQILSAWNDTRRDFPHERGIAGLFAEQVARTPDAVAFSCEGESLSYAELERRSNQMANHLRALGVGPEVIVGLCMDRSLEQTVALMGVVKAGGVYLPLDPAYPRERLEYILEDARAAVLVTSDSYAGMFPGYGGHVLRVDADRDLIAHESEEAPAPRTTPANLFHVVYTSGSTGRPKGVAATQREALNRLAWNWEAMPFKAGEVNCQKTALSFTDSLYEIFGALLCGVPSVIIPDRVLKDPFAFVRALAAGRVSRLLLVPSLLRAMLETHPDLQERLPALGLCVTSGEALSVELFERFREQVPRCTLINVYGSSEAWDSTWHNLSAASDKLRRVPIGRPLSNVRVYVLDPSLRPVPVGVAGELYVGGDGLARGYLNRPGLTAERFVPDPFSGEPGARLYRTGDVGCWTADGTLEYLGRGDRQVKVRGFRVELGEIESALVLHPSVRETVVTARDGQHGETLIAAYVVTDEPGPSDRELRQHLGGLLPDYMLPSAFVRLECLPLTPNGKVDRLALPEPVRQRPEAGELLVEPRTPFEAEVARIWAETLGVGRVGVEDNFFELGGHSLLATQVVSRVLSVFGVELPLLRLFETPTVAGVAAAVERLAGSARGGADSFIPRLSREEYRALLSPQGRLTLPPALRAGIDAPAGRPARPYAAPAAPPAGGS
ncbi:MAG: amino acid adenylation domain-containing protein [Acidobacteria bacterium]|nr:amino acid adenylation domain-containing protein [Acidobacteriota bacterium]